MGDLDQANEQAVLRTALRRHLQEFGEVEAPEEGTPGLDALKDVVAGLVRDGWRVTWHDDRPRPVVRATHQQG